jgi:SAM-dependent methyltransferase
MLKSQQDAYGQMIYDYYRGQKPYEIVERDDGWIGVSHPASLYFAPFRGWPKYQRDAMRYVRGKVIDVGCGAGRAALHLQERGHRVLGIDVSPLAIKTCRLRGVERARIRSITQVSRALGAFDTILMLGNNFGLMANPMRARWLLRRFASLTPRKGRIVAESLDPYDTKDPDNRRYHRWNRRRGRMGGQIRIRICYGRYRTPWFDYLLVSQREMREILHDTQWAIERVIGSNGPSYIVILRKAA